MSPDRGHFHHRLIDLGLSQKQAVAILYAISGLLGLTAVVIATSDELRAIIFIVAVLFAIGIAAFIFRGIMKGSPHPGGLPADPPGTDAAPTETSEPGKDETSETGKE